MSKEIYEHLLLMLAPIMGLLIGIVTCFPLIKERYGIAKIGSRFWNIPSPILKSHAIFLILYGLGLVIFYFRFNLVQYTTPMYIMVATITMNISSILNFRLITNTPYRNLKKGMINVIFITSGVFIAFFACAQLFVS